LRALTSATLVAVAIDLCTPHLGHAEDSHTQAPADAGVTADARPADAPPADVPPADAITASPTTPDISALPPTSTVSSPSTAAGDTGSDTTADASELIEVQGTAPAETGTSASIITRKDIEDLPGGNTQSLTEIALTQPGFTPDTFGPDGIFHIRGGETGVLYMIDGIQLPNGIAGQFTDVLPAALVQRMNLVVGGMPVEYGPSTGGVFDITTRRGSDVPAGEAEIVYGTYNKVEPSAWYSQAFGKLNVFAAGSYLSSDRGLDPPALTPILHDAERAGNAIARVNYDATDNDRIEIVTRYSQQFFQIPIDPTLLPLSDGPPGATRGSDSYGNAPAQFVPYDSDPTEAERDFLITAAYTHMFANGNLLVAPYFRYFSSNLECDPVHSLGATADPGSTCSNIDHDLYHEGANVTYAWNAGTSQRWKVGVIVDDSQSKDGYTQFTRDDASPQGGPNPALTVTGTDSLNIVSGGAYAQDEIRVGALTLLPGVRADFQDAMFQDTSQPNLMLASPSPRLGAQYALDSEFTLHGFAGYLWLPPNAVDASVAARLLVPGLEGQPIPIDVKAETDEDAELGLRYKRPRFDADLTAYGRLSQNTIDVTNVGETNLIVDYNYTRGRAYGAELSMHGVATSYLRGFANVSWDVAQGQGINSEQYLFTSQEVAYTGWQILDHVQAYTVNAGFDLHDGEDSHLAVTYQYGSGLRTGPDNNETVPGHSVWNVTLRHRFAFSVHPEIAIDVFNVFDEAYAIRIGNGFVGSAYGALREVDLRLTVPFGPRAAVMSRSPYESY
jgi:outer membrane cobalamin receptor